MPGAATAKGTRKPGLPLLPGPVEAAGKPKPAKSKAGNPKAGKPPKPAKPAKRKARGSKASSGAMAALIAVVATGAGAHYVQAHGGSKAPAFQCDDALWDHTYSHERFRDSNRTCTLAIGTITLVQQDPDMDDHIRLHLDPGQDWMLAQSNLDHQGGDLVLEVVCAHPANDKTTDIQKQACQGYTNKVTIPKVGDHVVAVGTFVTDMAHYNACPVSRAAQHCWNELHPVTSITKVP